MHMLLLIYGIMCIKNSGATCDIISHSLPPPHLGCMFDHIILVCIVYIAVHENNACMDFGA